MEEKLFDLVNLKDLENFHEVMSYFANVFENIVNNVIRMYSIYNNLLKYRIESKTAIDYYNLTFINLRILFEAKVKKSHYVSADEYMKKANRDYEFSFIQWIHYFYKCFDAKKINENKRDNKKNVVNHAEVFKKTLQEFEGIYNDSEIKMIGSSTVHPLRTRIINYASKYVAHTIEKIKIDKWEYNNKVFLDDKELEQIVLLLSKIEDNYRNLKYYYSNVVDVPEKDYSRTLESKGIEYFVRFKNDIKKIEI